jgi:hypothetical protein
MLVQHLAMFVRVAKTITVQVTPYLGSQLKEAKSSVRRNAASIKKNFVHATGNACSKTIAVKILIKNAVVIDDR